jgi:hypothetical protein
MAIAASMAISHNLKQLLTIMEQPSLRGQKPLARWATYHGRITIAYDGAHPEK